MFDADNPSRPALGRVPGAILYQAERVLRSRFEVPRRYSDHHVLLASFPRSGNTWLRFIVANLARLSRGESEEAIDFETVHHYAPTVRVNPRLENVVEAPGLPLFIKTHFPYIAPFERYRRVLVVRHPADSLLSYYWFLRKGRGKRVANPGALVRSWRYGARAWAAYHRSWLDRAHTLLRYEDLRANTESVVGGMYADLGYPQPPELVQRAIHASSKERMRTAQTERGDPFLPNPDFQVVRSGSVGEGRTALDDASWEYLTETCADIASRYGYDLRRDAETRRSGESG